jgi:hypothetical protein
MARFRSQRALRGRDGYALISTEAALGHLMQLTAADMEAQHQNDTPETSIPPE